MDRVNITFAVDMGMERKLGKMTDEMKDAQRKFIRKEGEELLHEAQAVTPVSAYGTPPYPPGHLRDSGYVAGPGFGDKVAVGFSAHYAIYVHEIITNKHPIGMAKFLETPFLTRATTMQPRYSAYMKEHVAKIKMQQGGTVITTVG